MSAPPQFCVAHLTTVDMSLRYLIAPQLRAVVEAGGVSVGISAPGRWVGDIEAMGVIHEPLHSSTRGMSVLADIRAAFELWKVLRRVQPTVLHTHNPKPGLYGRVIGRLAGVPLVVNTVHGLYATRDDPVGKQAAVYTLEAIAARFSDVELYQNVEDLRFARAIGLVPRHKSSLLGNGVDLTMFDRGSVPDSTRTRLRADLGADESSIVVGTVGRLVAEKGLPELFEAARRLDDRFRVVVIGPDDHDKPDSLPRPMIDAARESGVQFLGMREDVKSLYAAMDIFVLPSHREGFPRAAMEAAAMGLPVVTTDIRGCRQVVDHGVNGLLVPVDSPDELFEAISALGNDATMRRDMGLASSARSVTDFDETRVVDLVMASYVRGLQSKGLERLLPTALLEVDGEVTLRPATDSDVADLADMHVNGISSGFLPRLGKRFMEVLYSAMVRQSGTVVLIATDDIGPVGFVSGVVDTGSFYRQFLRTQWWRAALAVIPRVLKPSNMRRVWETLRYGDGEEAGPSSELLAMSVVPRARRRGLALDLGNHLLEALASLGVDEVKVVVGSDNRAAVAAYGKMGFGASTQIEVHAGESSEVMVWRR
jgi:glycosyltransferase involved in cell wall biosynthesis/ribosomal protein S18 acetylase RimI-like enzyme